MTTIKFLLIGDAGVGKSTLLKVYLWKLHCGLAFHDHRIDKRRYHIDVIEILTFNQLHQHHNYLYQNQQDIVINVLCFNVTDRKTLGTLRREWIPELLKINKDTKMFLMGLQCDLREQFLTKLTQNCFSPAEGIQVCLYYENLHYVECSSLKLACVNAAFEKMLEIFFYEDVQKQLEERILKLYAAMQIKFEFYGPVIYKDDREHHKEEEVKLKDATELEEVVSNNEIDTEALFLKDGTRDVIELEELVSNNEIYSEAMTLKGADSEVTMSNNEIDSEPIEIETEVEVVILNDESEFESLIFTDETENQNESNVVILKYETDLDAAFFENETENYIEFEAVIFKNAGEGEFSNSNEIENETENQINSTAVISNDDMELEEVILRHKS